MYDLVISDPDYEFCPILTREAKIVATILVPLKYREVTIDALELIGIHTNTLYPNRWPGMVELYTDACDIQNFSQLEKWQAEVQEYFDNNGIEIQVQCQIMDRDIPNSYGDIIEEEGRKWVDYTFNGPIRDWLRYPLSDYRIAH